MLSDYGHFGSCSLDFTVRGSVQEVVLWCLFLLALRSELCISLYSYMVLAMTHITLYDTTHSSQAIKACLLSELLLRVESGSFGAGNVSEALIVRTMIWIIVGPAGAGS